MELLIKKVRKYIKYHDYDIQPSPKAVRRAVNKIGVEYFEQILEIKYADMMAQSMYKRDSKQQTLNDIQCIFKDIVERNQCVNLKSLNITGDDLQHAGVPQGKQIGHILNMLLEDVIENPEHNTKEYLFEKIWSIFPKSTS